MKKMILLNTVLCTILLLSSGCASLTRKPAQATLNRNVQISEADLKKIGDESVKKILESLRTSDYKKHIACFVKEYADSMPERKFKEVSNAFNRRAAVKDLTYLGSINKVSCRVLLWKASFTRTKEAEENIRKDGLDPAKTPVPEAIVQLVLGQVGKEWKVIGFWLL